MPSPRPWTRHVPVAVLLTLLLLLVAAGSVAGSPFLASLGLTSSASLEVIFLTGLTAGGLSCLAVQGGLLATTVAHQATQADAAHPQGSGHLTATVLFLGAKLVAYTLLGALLGSLGAVVSLSPTARGWLQILIALLMIGVALQTFEVHPVFRRFLIQPPKAVQRYIRRLSKRGDAVTPLALGALTVFIPCGVTQAMALLAVSAGSPLQGALIMFAFVLGTSPLFFVLGLLTTRLTQAWQGAFRTLSAVAIVVMALSSAIGGVRLLGYTVGYPMSPAPSAAQATTNPVPEAGTSDAPPSSEGDSAASDTWIAQAEGRAPTQAGMAVMGADGFQEITIAATDWGYEPTRLKVRAGTPTRLTLVTENNYSCARNFVIPDLQVDLILPETGKEKVEFLPERPGAIAFTCGMGMYQGVIEVVE